MVYYSEVNYKGSKIYSICSSLEEAEQFLNDHWNADAKMLIKHIYNDGHEYLDFGYNF